MAIAEPLLFPVASVRAPPLTTVLVVLATFAPEEKVSKKVVVVAGEKVET